MGLKNNCERLCSICIFCFSLIFVLSHSGWGDTSKTSTTTKRSESNLNFDIPDDWPIEERNGTLGPIPIEEYLGLKFKGVNEKLSKTEKQVNDLDQRIKVLEELLKRPRKLREGASEENESTKV